MQIRFAISPIKIMGTISVQKLFDLFWIKNEQPKLIHFAIGWNVKVGHSLFIVHRICWGQCVIHEKVQQTPLWKSKLFKRQDPYHSLVDDVPNHFDEWKCISCATNVTSECITNYCWKDSEMVAKDLHYKLYFQENSFLIKCCYTSVLFLFI